MAFNKLFSTPEEILAEFLRQEEDSEVDENNLFENELSSDSEDGEIENSDNCEDEFSDLDEELDLTLKENESDKERYFELGRNGDAIWTNLPLTSKFSRTPASNIVTHLPGPKGEAKGMTDELELFNLFVTDSMISEIVFHTNKEIENSQKSFQSKQWNVGFTDAMEIRAVIGLLFFSGV